MAYYKIHNKEHIAIYMYVHVTVGLCTIIEPVQLYVLMTIGLCPYMLLFLKCGTEARGPLLHSNR